MRCFGDLDAGEAERLLGELEEPNGSAYVYILGCMSPIDDDTALYVGQTTRIGKRTEEHIEGTASSFTAHSVPVGVVGVWSVDGGELDGSAQDTASLKVEEVLHALSPEEKQRVVEVTDYNPSYLNTLVDVDGITVTYRRDLTEAIQDKYFDDIDSADWLDMSEEPSFTPDDAGVIFAFSSLADDRHGRPNIIDVTRDEMAEFYRCAHGAGDEELRMCLRVTADYLRCKDFGSARAAMSRVRSHLAYAA